MARDLARLSAFPRRRPPLIGQQAMPLRTRFQPHLWPRHGPQRGRLPCTTTEGPFLCACRLACSGRTTTPGLPAPGPPSGKARLCRSPCGFPAAHCPLAVSLKSSSLLKNPSINPPTMGVLQDDIWRKAMTGTRGEIWGFRLNFWRFARVFWIPCRIVAYRGVKISLRRSGHCGSRP